VEASPYGFYVQGFEEVLGGGAGIAVIMLCAGIVLSMNTATLDGSRALYGISRADMTLKWFGRLNRAQVPGNAMTLDALLNIAVLVLFAGPSAVIQILTFSNFGYVFAHVVAMSGFLLLRRDRPNWPRPIRVSSFWVPVAWFLLACDLVFLIVGSLSFKLTGYGDYKELFIGIGILAISLVLYVIRVVVEDKKKLQWRLPDDPAQPARRVETPTAS
jgi:amino acid transporter